VKAGALALALALVVSVGEAKALDPDTFVTVSTGIVRVRADCAEGVSLGTGFLVGSRVVMTARHIVKGCRHVEVHTANGAWAGVTTVLPWYTADRSDTDVATLRLETTSDGYVFHFRRGQAPAGANLAALGHPLGMDLALTQGKVMFRTHRQIFVRLLGAEGESGSPLVDGHGNVVAILQQGWSQGTDLIGQRTAGVVSGYDFSSRWATWRRDLCHAYPFGGIADCA
jgi:S1-C subfamily serine protease